MLFVLDVRNCRFGSAPVARLLKSLSRFPRLQQLHVLPTDLHAIVQRSFTDFEQSLSTVCPSLRLFSHQSFKTV